MKTKQAVKVAVLMVLALMAGYWIGHEHGSGSRRGSLAGISSLKQVGLSFRQSRNDWSAPFSATGAVVASEVPAR